MSHDQKKIEELIAAGGAQCELCGRRMLIADGCTCSEVIAGGKRYKRIKYGDEDFPWPGERCHDCGAKSGTIITLTAMWSNAPCAVGSSLAVTAVWSTQNNFGTIK